MPIAQSILERIATFSRNLDSYLNQNYKEARVRQEFIDPLFAALGWDVRNEQGYAEAYKDVVRRFLGESREMRFTQQARPTFFQRLFAKA